MVAHELAVPLELEVLPDLLSRQQTKELIDRVGQTSPKLIEELIPKLATIGDVQRLLRQLLREVVHARLAISSPDYAEPRR